jgi:hypothetical protein
LPLVFWTRPLVSGSWLVALEEFLQNQRSCYLVYYSPVGLPLMAGLVEDPVRLAGGQALVPEVDGQPGKFAQLGGKGLGLDGLRTCFAGKVCGIAHDDPRHAKPPAEPRQGAQIFPAAAPALEGQHRLSGQPKLV